ncbi:MAG: hypothetical protein P1V21_14455 [Rhizobiaceae bacterium]|nr:hypothetical protein [Rhizobiaceae bacterium]
MIEVKERPIPWAAQQQQNESSDILASARFSPAQIANATGVPVETLRSWFKRGILSLDDENMGEGPESIGMGRKLTGYTAMVVAIMGRLTGAMNRNKREGMSLEAARDHAYKFVHAGTEERLPCMIFADGETLLVIPKNAPDPARARVVQMKMPDKPQTWNDINSLFRGTRQVEILCMTELWQEVFQHLGIRAEVERQGRISE